MTPSYDAIVVGLGAMGSATIAHLARRGHRVLGIDAHARGHDRGSSHGKSRIIREAYAEAPDYVPLVQRSYTLWRELEAETGRTLLTITGGLGVDRPDGEFVAGALLSAQLHNLPAEHLTPAEVAARFPGFRLSEDMVAVYEPRAGILAPEACVAAHLDVAARHGVEMHHEEPVTAWRADGRGVRVESEQGAYAADRLVLTPGPWAGEILAELGLPLVVERIVNVHFEPTRPELFTPDRCPVYILHVPEGPYYGFPALPGQGLKFGRHDGGETTTPETIRRTVDRSEIDALRAVLDRYMPGAAGEVKWAITCMYTNTPDRHFIVDRHPRHDRVVYACGFSGHGFKFSSAIGEVLADLAIQGTTRHEIGFLSARRSGRPGTA